MGRFFRSLGLQVPSRREWVAGGCVALVFGLLAVSSQIAAVVAARSAGLHATGLPITNNIDQPSYLDVIWQAREGAWFFRNSLTPEPNAAVQFRPLFLLLGWVSAASRLAPALVWNISIAISAAALALVLYFFVAQLFTKRSERLFALLLVLLSGGLGWLNLWWPQVLPLTSTDVFVPESNTLHATTCCTQFSWSPMLLIGITALLWFANRHTKVAVALSGILAFFLVLDHPYDAPLVAIVSLVAVLVAFARHESVKLAVLRVAGALAGTTLAAVIVLVGVSLSPELQRWNDQNVLPSGPLLPWLSGFGLLLLFAGIGLVRKRSWSATALTFWVVLQGVAVFLPLSFARRLSEGWHIPVALLAAMGLFSLSKRWSIRLPLALGTAIFAMALLHDQWSYAAESAAQDRVRPFFELGRLQSYPDSYRDALVWLRANHLDADVVAASPTNGGLLVAETGVRVVAGHWAQTLDPDAKHAELADLFAGRMTLDEYAKKYSVTYLWIAREERQYLTELGRTEQELLRDERPVFSNQDVSIYDLGKLE